MLSQGQPLCRRPWPPPASPTPDMLLEIANVIDADTLGTLLETISAGAFVS